LAAASTPRGARGAGGRTLPASASSGRARPPPRRSSSPRPLSAGTSSRASRAATSTSAP
jgi:hypothetical protein